MKTLHVLHTSTMFGVSLCCLSFGGNGTFPISTLTSLIETYDLLTSNLFTVGRDMDRQF